MINVYCLGNFSIKDTRTGIVLDEAALHSPRLKKLATYLMLHRDQPIPAQEFYDNIWQEDEADNPVGALKNLMYRFRKVMEEVFDNNLFILTNQGSYSWNPKIGVWMDVEEFESLCKQATASDDANVRIELLEQALELYRGDFLDGSGDLHWQATETAYLRSMYLTAVKNLVAMYTSQEKYSRCEDICAKALTIDPTDEDLYAYMIRAMICQKKFDVAKKTLDNARTVMKRQLGIYNSITLNDIEQELMNVQEVEEAEGLSEISTFIREEDPDGAFFCMYPAFREIYRLEARKIGRLGEAEFLLLLSAKPKSNDMENDKMEKFFMNHSMDRMKNVLMETLRIGDVFARYSESQFIVLLPTCTEECTHNVCKRIMSNYAQNYRNERFEFEADMEPVVSVGSKLIH